MLLNRNSLSGLALLCGVLMSSASVAENASSPTADPLAVVTAFEAALHSGDQSAVLALLDPQVLIYESGGVESSAQEYASHHLAADMAFMKQMNSELLAAHVIDMDGYALVTRRSRMHGQYKGKQLALNNTETMLLARHGESWRIRHIHWSSSPEK